MKVSIIDYISETANRYNIIAEDFYRRKGKLRKIEIFYLDKFISYLSGDKVLDLGCGTGKDTAYLLSHGLDVYGLDLSSEMLKLAERHEPKLKNRLYKMDMRDMEFDEIFDGIWANSSLVHFNPNDRTKMLKKCYFALKPQGILHVCHQNFWNPKRFLRAVKYRKKYYFFDGRHFFPEDIFGLKKQIKNAGFDIIEIEFEHNIPISSWLRAYAKK